MRFSHSRLEEARQNPKKFKNSLEGESGFSGRPGRYRYWQYATRKYHNEGMEAAEKHLMGLFSKFAQNRKSDRLLEEFILYLHTYANDYEELGNEVFKIGDNLKLEINYNNTIGGEIHRLDFRIKGGYEIYLMIKEDFIWENELRFPLIQHFYAEQLGCQYSEIGVGVYCFELGEHVIHKYSEDEIEKALIEVDRISNFLK